MNKYLITGLPPGSMRDEIVQFFNSIGHPFRVSSKENEITGYVHDFEESAAVPSRLRNTLDPQDSIGQPEIAARRQRLAAGSDGPNPFDPQGTLTLRREPRALNAVDILLETPLPGGPDVLCGPGNPRMDCIVKKEEQEDTNIIYHQDRRRQQQQQTYPLFSLGTNAEALMKEEQDKYPGATEVLVKEEIDDSEDQDEGGGEKYSEETHQDAPIEVLVTYIGHGLYQCNLCNDFYLSAAMIAHWRSHPRCSYCQKRFSTEEILLDHKRIHTTCDVCGLVLPNLSRLKDHRRLHTGEKPFECEFCQKCFRTDQLWKIHVRNHTGEKLYEREVCRKHFTQKCNLNVHMRTHTGEKPYECSECQKRFANSSSWRKHRRLHGIQKKSV